MSDPSIEMFLNEARGIGKMGSTRRGLSDYRGKPGRLLETNLNQSLSHLPSNHKVRDLPGA